MRLALSFTGKDPLLLLKRKSHYIDVTQTASLPRVIITAAARWHKCNHMSIFANPNFIPKLSFFLLRWSDCPLLQNGFLLYQALCECVTGMSSRSSGLSNRGIKIATPAVHIWKAGQRNYWPLKGSTLTGGNKQTPHAYRHWSATQQLLKSHSSSNAKCSPGLSVLVLSFILFFNT